MRILMAGGGTGGHLFPGLALARQLRQLDPEVAISFIGTRYGLDLEIVPRSGYSIDILAAGRGSPISRKNPLNAPRFALALLQCAGLFRQYKPDVLVALGGYAAAAPGIVARLFKIPVVILEQNSIPGRVNRLLARWAKRIYLQFRCARTRFEKTNAKFYDFGSPMREEMVRLVDEKPCSGKALLIMGGSQGAQSLNRIVLEAISEISKETSCEIIHVAGPGNEDEIRAAYQMLGISASVHGFFGSMESCYRSSRLVISRSGAGSLAELGLAGLPSLLVPLPDSMDDHQRHNARWLEESGAAVVLEQTILTPAMLAKQVTRLWNDAELLERMGHCARRTARPGAAREIAQSILEMKSERL